MFLAIKLRDKFYFSFSVPTPGFPHFYYMLGANLGLLLYGEVSVMEISVFATCHSYNESATVSFKVCFQI